MQCGGQEGFRTVTALVAIILWLKSSLHVEHLVWYCSVSQWCAVGGEGSGCCPAAGLHASGWCWTKLRHYLKADGLLQRSKKMDGTVINDIHCASDGQSPQGIYWDSLLYGCSMFLGDVDGTKFHSSRFARIIFVVFVFVAAILLTNLSIAKLIDWYRRSFVHRRALVWFWTNRLDFVSQTCGIVDTGWMRWLLQPVVQVDTIFGEELWDRCMSDVSFRPKGGKRAGFLGAIKASIGVAVLDCCRGSHRGLVVASTDP